MVISKNSGPQRPKICSKRVEMDSSSAVTKRHWPTGVLRVRANRCLRRE